MLASLWLGATAALAATLNEPTFQAVVTEPNQACVTKDFGGHHCPTTCSGMTDISSASITTSAQCIAACCADPKIKVCTYAGFEDATKTCVAGDWTPCSSCRKLSGWTTTLINFGPPSPPSPPSPSPPPPPPPPPSPSPPPPPSPPSPTPGGGTTSTFTFVDASGAALKGAQIEGQDPTYLRSGAVPQKGPVSATLTLSLTPGTTITGVSFAYQYETGYKGTVGANFTLDVAGTAAYSSPTVNNYPYSKSGGIGAYSPAVNVASKGLSIAVPSSGGGVAFNFHNIDRNLQLALPMTINITCTGSSACFSGAAPPGPPPPPPGGACTPNAAGCCDFSGEWCNHANSDGIMTIMKQPTGTCTVSAMVGGTAGECMVPHCLNGTVSGDTMSIVYWDRHTNVNTTRTATLELDTPQDILTWHYPGPNGNSKWYRGGNNGTYTCRKNCQNPPCASD